MEIAVSMRLRPCSLKRVEQAFVRLFSFERGNFGGIAEKWCEGEILDSLAVYTSVAGGECALAYDRGGFPTFLKGWRGSLEEIEVALRTAEQGIEALMSPLTFASHPALLNPAWKGWGPAQAAVYLSFFFGLIAASSSALSAGPPDAAGVG